MGPNFEHLGNSQKLDWAPGEGIITVTLDTGIVPGTKALVVIKYTDNERYRYQTMVVDNGFVLLKMPRNGKAKWEVTILNGETFMPLAPTASFEYTR